MVELRLSVHDRVGLLRDVSGVFTRQKINMKSVATEAKNRAYPVIVIHMVLKQRTDLEKIMVKLKEVKGVVEVGYKIVH